MFDIRLAATYATLSSKLKQAADYVVAHPVDTATRSLRSVAEDSGVAPATFSRLARALDYDSFEDLREVIRATIGRKVDSFSARAERLQSNYNDNEGDFLTTHLTACLNNISSFAEQVDKDQLESAVTQLHKSRKVLLFGALGSTAIVEYMSYMASFLTDNWAVAGHMGGSVGRSMVALDSRDALLIVTKPPFSPRAIHAAMLARERGVHVIVITDSHTCPALRHASTAFIVPTQSPHFYSSYTATLFLVETMIGMLAARAGAGAGARIAEIEDNNRRMQEVCDGPE